MKKYLILLFFCLVSIFLSSCGFWDKNNSDEPDIPELPIEQVDRTILIYAINKSSLASDFSDDYNEIISALGKIDLSSCRLLLYKTESDEECALYSSKKVEEVPGYRLEKIKSYKRRTTSTDPDRIAEVIDYTLSLCPESRHDLIFWGHGSSWVPGFSGHEIPDQSANNKHYAYGGEYPYTGDYSTNWAELDELAYAVPDGKFDTIWFDCCYMSSIEVIYELKDKCNYFVGYPTEVWAYGMDYSKILPIIFEKDRDLTLAAKEFYNSYKIINEPVTVAVLDMKNVETIASLASEIIRHGDERPSISKLLNYSRMKGYPFYDFFQFFSETAVVNDCDQYVESLREAMNKLVIYHAESDMNFSKYSWDTSNISGISTHFYKGLATDAEEYYRTLSWYKRVYAQ